MQPTQQSIKQRGFTLVEMLVVAPLVIIVIATIIGFMISLIGNVAIANSRGQSMYDAQSALTQIERDTFLSTGFLGSYSPVSPMGKDGNTSAFTTAAGDIVINQIATDKNPADSSRSLVYRAIPPAACGGAVQPNFPMYVKVIYYINNQTLYRRTIVPQNNQNLGSPDTQTTCLAPWQRSSCTSGCAAKDVKLLNNVTGMTATYYSNGVPTTDPTVADNVKVSLNISQKTAGETLVDTPSLFANRGYASTPPALPSNPVVTVQAPAQTDYNNPRLTTFQWSSSDTVFYTVSYQVNGGAWSAPANTTNTTWQIDSAAGQSVSIKVRAYNDMGRSAEVQASRTTPIFSDINLQNSWECYAASTYYCPQFTRTSAGVVLLRGLAKLGDDNGCSDSIIGTLPEGFRPEYTLSYPVLSNGNSLTNINIYSNGNISWRNCLGVSGANGWVSLDGLQLLASDVTGLTWDTFSSYSSGWAPYVGGGGYRQDGKFFGKDSLGRAHAYGLIMGPTNSPADYGTLATMKAAFIPPTNESLIVNSSNANGLYSYVYLKSASQFGYRLNGAGLRSLSAMYYPTGTSVTWSNITLTASTRGNYGAEYANSSYTKASDNIVALRGMPKNITVSTLSLSQIGTLPSGYRPARSMVFLAPGGSCPGTRYARVDIEPTGAIKHNCTPGVATNAWFSLGGLNYYPDGT